MTERLQKLIARSGLCSRRAAEALLTEGRVTVNGAAARLGDKADPETDAIAVDGKPLTFAEPMVDAGTVEIAVQDVLYDPQTAGGLLIACDPADADALYGALQGAVPSAQRIGTVEPYTGGARIYLK